MNAININVKWDNYGWIAISLDLPEDWNMRRHFSGPREAAEALAARYFGHGRFTISPGAYRKTYIATATPEDKR